MVGWRLLGVRRDFWDCVFAWCVTLFTAATSLVAQVSVTSERAKETAQALAGKKVDKAEVYSSQDGRAEYLAFAAYIDLEKRGGSQDLWLYKRAGETFEKVWHGEFQSPDFGFVTLPGETLPSLRIYEMACGSGGCGTTLSLYSLQRKQLLSMVYYEDRAATPNPVVKELDYKVTDPTVKAWLKNWAREVGVFPQKTPSVDFSDPMNIEAAWVNDNGHRVSGEVKLRYYDRVPRMYSAEPQPVGRAFTDQVKDDRFTWTAFFKAGVVGFDHLTRRYFMVYLPESRYSWIQKLALRGNWLYMSDDCFSPRRLSDTDNEFRDSDCTWKLRFNKATHRLEQGRFDSAVKGGGETTAKKPSAKTPSRSGRENDTLTWFRTLVRLNPNNANAHYNLGAALLTYGSLDEAIAELRSAIALDPSLPEAHMTLGAALMRAGRTQEAQKEFELGTELSARKRCPLY